MTVSETQFRNWMKKYKPGAFIKKIPDFKQLGHLAAVGLPDYIVIDRGQTLWVEVKYGFGWTLNLKNHFTPAQKIVFKKMLDNGVDVMIYAKPTKGRPVLTFFSVLLKEGTIKFEKGGDAKCV